MIEVIWNTVGLSLTQSRDAIDLLERASMKDCNLFLYLYLLLLILGSQLVLLLHHLLLSIEVLLVLYNI